MTHNRHKIKIAISMGDPAGIGPEISAKALSELTDISSDVDIMVYGCPDVINEAVKRFSTKTINIKIRKTGNLNFKDFHSGKIDKNCAIEALKAVEIATKDCLRGNADAIVTCPVNKAAINLAGIKFTGHTEFIADLCGIKEPVMMQSAGDIRIAFVTTHIPLRRVSENITVERIIRVTELLRQAIVLQGVREPKIAIAALNPHAGENGYMGTEENEIIIPACKKLKKREINISEPFPPDTLFIEKTLKQFDGIVSMYHDQGHIPFKIFAFDIGVNSTLGLPIIRTSVDHGTAFNIAWKNLASPNSLIAAVRTAVKMAIGKKISDKHDK